MQKPSIPITIIALALVAAAGLITQFLAAEHAFGLIGRTTLYSVMAAVLIESAIVVDAVVVARNRNLLALVGLVLAMAVSAVYNYLLADTATVQYTLQLWQKLALAIGPLFAMVTIGLALGEELFNYGARLDAYNLEQAERDELVQTELQRDQRASATYQEQAERESADFERQLTREHQEHTLREERLATRRAERWARKLAEQVPVAQLPDNGRDAPSAIDELLVHVPGALASIDAYEHACKQYPAIAARIKPKQLAARIDQSPRTARRWCARIR